MIGLYTLPEDAADLKARRLRARSGRPTSTQTSRNFCRSPTYGGLLRGAWTEQRLIRARFDGPLTPEEWRRLRQILDGCYTVPARSRPRNDRQGPSL